MLNDMILYFNSIIFLFFVVFGNQTIFLFLFLYSVVKMHDRYGLFIISIL